ncbi:B4GALNT2 [Branchiostoma lanceolatum]|uniref:B4GALNT2 protein n=1 Tax=Branchiostoma lanceolatum TaxID=7740 RepID=A0A8J9WEY9_BRALA|nr:B4GALNT2 [Branchiostoma lanceolatum]
MRDPAALIPETMFIPIMDRKSLLVAIVSFILGNTLTTLWCWIPALPCNTDHPVTASHVIGQPRAPAGYEVKTILRTSHQEDANSNLPSDPRVTEYIGEKECVCTGKWHKDFFPPEKWAERQKGQEASLERYTRRRSNFKDFHNQVDGFSPISYPAHGLYVRPLRAVRLQGLQIEWCDSKRHFSGAELQAKLHTRRGIFKLLTDVKTVKVEGVETADLVIRTSIPTLLNLQLQQVVYQNTEFDGNTFDIVEFYFDEFNATIPIHIQHRQVTWLFEQGQGRVQDRVTVVVKAFLRYDHSRQLIHSFRRVQDRVTVVVKAFLRYDHVRQLIHSFRRVQDRVTVVVKAFLRYDHVRQLIHSFRRFYPGTRIIVADDSPKERYQDIKEEYTDHYRMPDYAGFFAGRNLGLSQVTTEYFLYMDDDHYLRPSTKLETLVALLDNTDFHVASGAYEDLEEFASAIRVVGNRTHACFEKLRKHYHEIDGFPDCYAADHTENFFLASTAEVKAVGFDPHPAQARVGHQEFFTAALGRLRIAVCRFVIVGHNKSAEPDPLYEKYRRTDRKYRDMRTTHNLYRDNLTCTGLKYPRIETYALHMMISAVIIICSQQTTNMSVEKKTTPEIFDPDSTPEKTAEYYDNWSGHYEEEIITQLKCTAPRVCAAAVAKALGGPDRGKVRILDVAAGTGSCGEELVRLGFKGLDGVDGSPDMLKLAERKQIYNRLICDFVGPNPLDIENDTYDAIACCSAFAPGHLKEECLPELIRVVKPGGHIVITFREEYLHTVENYRDRLEPCMARLQQEGLWERVTREVFPKFYEDKDGITFVYKVM